MNLISWNCLGLRNYCTIHNFHHLENNYTPGVLFFMETKSQNHKMVKLINKFGFDNVFAIESVGSRGGLTLLWKSTCHLEILNYFQHHIVAIVSNPSTNRDGRVLLWKFTCQLKILNYSQHHIAAIVSDPSINSC